MSILSENIKHLRKEKNYSQQKLADELIITRARLAKYEEAINEPPLEILKRIASYFGLSIDILVSVDLRKIPLKNLVKLDNNRVLLPITISKDGKERIEIVSEKASAGYTLGYSDPEYIESLQKMSIPFLTAGNYRAFPIQGDSMLPVQSGSFIIGKYVEKVDDVKNGKTYIVVSQNDGLVYKRVYKKGKYLELYSDNKLYEPYKLHLNEVLELWEFALLLSKDDNEPEHIEQPNVVSLFQAIRKDIKELKNG